MLSTRLFSKFAHQTLREHGRHGPGDARCDESDVQVDGLLNAEPDQAVQLQVAGKHAKQEEGAQP